MTRESPDGRQLSLVPVYVIGLVLIAIVSFLVWNLWESKNSPKKPSVVPTELRTGASEGDRPTLPRVARGLWMEITSGSGESASTDGRRIRKLAEEAVNNDAITARDRRRIMETFENGMRGYTYFER